MGYQPFFDVSKPDERGVTSLKVPPRIENEVAEEMRRGETRGVSVYAGLLILQERLLVNEARLSALESIPRVTEVATAAGRGSAGQARKPIKRMGRSDLCRFGYRPDPCNGAKLLPDKEEQETIRRAQHLRSFGLSLREICLRLDQDGRDRRGKKWEGSHSVLGAILKRNKPA